MKLSKSRMFVIAILGALLGYQVYTAITKDTVEPYPFNDTDMGQIRPGVYK